MLDTSYSTITLALLVGKPDCFGAPDTPEHGSAACRSCKHNALCADTAIKMVMGVKDGLALDGITDNIHEMSDRVLSFLPEDYLYPPRPLGRDDRELIGACHARSNPIRIKNKEKHVLQADEKGGSHLSAAHGCDDEVLDEEWDDDCEAAFQQQLREIEERKGPLSADANEALPLGSHAPKTRVGHEEEDDSPVRPKPHCFTDARVYASDSQICQKCHVHKECSIASLESLKLPEHSKGVDLEDLLRRHAIARSGAMAERKKEEEERIAEADAEEEEERLLSEARGNSRIVPVSGSGEIYAEFDSEDASARELDAHLQAKYHLATLSFEHVRLIEGNIHRARQRREKSTLPRSDGHVPCLEYDLSGEESIAFPGVEDTVEASTATAIPPSVRAEPSDPPAVHASAAKPETSALWSTHPQRLTPRATKILLF
ncbi:hypothetical protein, partial [Candidatus Accumulibacter aalborgensis]|uniref:hypothetical protein n=1 Tax=Candidatus Accumulibacter aalborgensis TaxID=1860102 RepID=UPI0016477792